MRAFLAERGPVQSNDGIGFDVNLIYSSDIGQTSAIHIPFCSLHRTVNALHGNLRLQLAMCEFQGVEVMLHLHVVARKAF